MSRTSFFFAPHVTLGLTLTLFVALAGCGAASGLMGPDDGGVVADVRTDVPHTPPDIMPVDVPVTGSCRSNADCDTSPFQYCAGSGCDTPGTCLVRPDVCRDPIGGPTCGCDGVTYSNDCLAAVAGVRVAFEGFCEGSDVVPPPDDHVVPFCLRNGDCAGSEYCATTACGAPGSCARRPDACSRGGVPVCSCDGNTFENVCFAQMSGASVAFTGTCGGPPPFDGGPGFDGGPPPFDGGPRFDGSPPPFDGGPRFDGSPPPFDGAPAGCRSNAECSPSELCEQPSCGGVGFCLPRAIPCTPAAVCGCDGRTYMSACFAFAAGVSIASLGACGGPITDGGPPPPFDGAPAGCRSNRDCAPTDTCQGMSCFGPGTCFTRSIPCVGGAVCGCDGVTYGQACMAVARGVRVASFAPCGTTSDGGVPLPDVIGPRDGFVVDVSTGCFSNAACGPGSFCYASGCGTVGRCIAEPPMCPPIVSPVCGCDGVTYDNFCVAFQNGERFAHAGMCGSAGFDGGGGGGFPGDGGDF